MGNDTRALQSIIISKEIAKTKQQAIDLVRGLQEDNPGIQIKKVDETETSYRFRQRNPNDFKEGSLKTSQIKEGISFVTGELRDDKFDENFIAIMDDALSFEDINGRVPILKTGSFMKEEFGETIFFSITESDLDRVIRNNKDIRKIDIAIDKDHKMASCFSDDQDAIGWAKPETFEKERQDDGTIILYAKAELTEQGKEEVKSKRRKYISPVVYMDWKSPEAFPMQGISAGDSLGMFVWNLALCSVPFFNMPEVQLFSSRKQLHFRMAFSQRVFNMEDLLESVKMMLKQRLLDKGSDETTAEEEATGTMNLLAPMLKAWYEGMKGAPAEAPVESADPMPEEKTEEMSAESKNVLASLSSALGLKFSTADDVLSAFKAKDEALQVLKASVQGDKDATKQKLVESFAMEFQKNRESGRHGSHHKVAENLFIQGVVKDKKLFNSNPKDMRAYRDDADISNYRMFVDNISPVTSSKKPEIKAKVSDSSDLSMMFSSFINKTKEEEGRKPTFYEADMALRNMVKE